MFWFGANPRVHITDPDQIREILSNKFGHFAKVRANPLVSLLVKGLVSYEGEKWAKHRRVLNPAFHAEKLKVPSITISTITPIFVSKNLIIKLDFWVQMMLPAMWASCDELISKWEQLVVPQGSCEVDVWPELQSLTADVISRTAFGSSYKEGNRIFMLQREQAELMIQAAFSVYVPGLRYILLIPVLFM